LVFVACLDASPVVAVPLEGGAASDDGRAIDPNEEDDDGGGSSTRRDSGSDADTLNCVGKFVPPVLNGGGPCGTGGFGMPAAAFGPVDGGADYSGTNLKDGIYDAVGAERASALAGSWRETLVVQGNRFTRIRQVDTGSGSGLGAETYRSGTFAYEAGGQQLIKFTYDCAQNGDAGTDAGSDTLPSDAVENAQCGAQYRYGVTGIRVTFRRRTN